MIALKIQPQVSFAYLHASGGDFREVAYLLSDVAPFYPNFKEWLFFKFQPEARLGMRDVLLACVDDQIVGLSLLKKTAAERKICTFYVVPSFRGRGLAYDLMDRSISAIGGSDTVITVSEERDAELFPTLNKFGFELSDSVQDMYRPGKKENIYRVG